MIASRDAIVFAKVNADNECDGQVIDYIPLSEVEGVCCAETGVDSSWVDVPHGIKKPENEGRSSLRQSLSTKPGDSNRIKSWDSFQIRTDIDGYNSGRTYHLQPSSATKCAELAEKLASAAAAAKKAKEAKTRFEKSQARMPVMRRPLRAAAVGPAHNLYHPPARNL